MSRFTIKLIRLILILAIFTVTVGRVAVRLVFQFDLPLEAIKVRQFEKPWMKWKWDDGMTSLMLCNSSQGSWDKIHAMLDDAYGGLMRTAKSILQNCTGTPQERRMLTMLGNKASQKDWEHMTEYVTKRRNSLHYHFGLHVSKSGGSSLCDLLRKQKCWKMRRPKNCQDKPREFDFSPIWYRKSINPTYKMNFPPWAFITDNTNNRDDVQCEEIANYLNRTQQGVIMSENYLPNYGTPCDDGQFSNFIMLREPMERLLSHYNHIFPLGCNMDGPQTRNFCKSLLLNTTADNKIHVFNATLLAQAFDVITDNYYTRSLNNKEVYISPFGLTLPGQNQTLQAGKDVLDQALQNLHKFDWVLLLGYHKGNEAILTDGLGFPRGMGFSNVRGSKNNTFLTNAGNQYLESINTLDQRIWREAQMLHALDVISIKKMQQSNFSSSNPYQSESKRCCGNICR